MKKGCEALHRCEEMVNKLGLFSPNETKDDISTANLKYILVRTSWYSLPNLISLGSSFSSFYMF